jgi:hypothetical protein
MPDLGNIAPTAQNARRQDKTPCGSPKRRPTAKKNGSLSRTCERLVVGRQQARKPAVRRKSRMLLAFLHFA